MKFKQFTLDLFQEEAIKAIEANNSVVVSAPTGSGKTLIADFIINKHKDDNKRIIYTAPIKALSNQKYKDFSKEYGQDKIGLMTGDIVINPEAKVVIMTTEIYRNMAISKDNDIKNIAYVIFDEVHYINDKERGYVWEESIIYSHKNVRFLALSATIPNAKEFSNWISAIKGHKVETVVATKRNVPLTHKFYDYELGLTTLKKIKEAMSIPGYHNVFRRRGGGRGKQERTPQADHVELIKTLGKEKTPCLFFTFSRKDCQNKANQLSKVKIFKRDPKIQKIMSEHFKNMPTDVNKLKSTQVLKSTLPNGIGFHHAGLLPAIKELVEDLFGQGLINVLYTTETFAVGINMPGKTVCFASLRKYDGISFRTLNTKEYFQIAGRAGRRGIDKEGTVVSMIFRPTFKYKEIKTLTYADIDPIKSQFKLSTNTVLNLLDQHTLEEIEHILRLSFFSYQKFGNEYDQVPTKKLMARYNSICRKLKKYGYIKDTKLTAKGKFSSKIFADEIAFGEIFATHIVNDLNEHQILLALCSLIYEYRETHRFKQYFCEENYRSVKKKLRENEFLSQYKKFENLKIATTFIGPIIQQKTLFDILELTNLLEGDLIRIYSQILDRIGQVLKASADFKVRNKMLNCKDIVKKVLEGIYDVD